MARKKYLLTIVIQYNTIQCIMAMRTIYIRKEYEELFDSLKNKSEFIAWALKQLQKQREQTKDM